MKFRKFLVVFSSILLLALGSITSAAGAVKDNFDITPQNSNDYHIVPFTPGNAQSQWRYFYPCVPTSGLVDTIVVNFAITNHGSPGNTYDISTNIVGNPNLADHISPSPSSFSNVPDDGTPQQVTISINTGGLSTGVYTAQIHFSADPASGISFSHDTIHIQIVVSDTCGGENPPLCFLTDSAFNPLTDCSGVPLESSTGGTFPIVTNKKDKIVATNPGQFYYNLIWVNGTGSSHTLDLYFDRHNLVPHGTNAVHAYVFESAALDPADPLVSQFDMVNESGVPCGSGDDNPAVCKSAVTINDGQIIWVTWHLEYSKIGTNANSLDLGNTCSESVLSNDGTIQAALVVKDGATILASCDASAQGNLKQ